MTKFNALFLTFLIFLLAKNSNICLAQIGDDDTKYTPNKNFPEEITQKIYDYYKAHKDKIPNENALKNMKIDKNIPADVTSVLQKYDLMDVCEYQFHPSGGDYVMTEKWHVYERYHSQKGALEFMFRNFENENVRDFSYSRNYFTTPKKIEKKGEYYYFIDAKPTHEGISYHPIVSLKDNLLIIDVTVSGKLGDINNPMRFRNVYLLMPRIF